MQKKPSHMAKAAVKGFDDTLTTQELWHLIREYAAPQSINVEWFIDRHYGMPGDRT